MTMAIVIARKDSFLIIADTRTEGNHPDYPDDPTKHVYHNQTQKVFHSARHRIGLCMAGNDVLVDANHPNDSQHQIEVSYVLREYFTHIEQNVLAGNLDITQLRDNLMHYISQNYSDYLTSFRTGVHLFYGGFNQAGRTQIYSWTGSRLNTFEFKDDSLNTQLCAFSNCTMQGNSFIEYLTDKLVTQYKEMLRSERIYSDSFSPKRNLNNFLCVEKFEKVLNSLVPYYRNTIHQDLGRDTYIGKKFDFFKINSPTNPVPLTHFGYELALDSNGYEKLDLINGNDLPTFFNYSISKTPDDEEAARINGFVIYYDQDHEELELQNAPAANSQTKISDSIFS